MLLTAFCKTRCPGLIAYIKTGRMKYVFSLFPLALFVFFCTNTSAQGITLSVKDASLESVIQQIQHQTDYRFIYTDGLLQESKKVSLSVQAAMIQPVLELVFKDQPFSYSIEDKIIMVRKKERKTDQLASTEGIDVAGKVVNEQGEGLANVSILLKGKQKAVMTDQNGRFELKNIEPGAILLVSSIGYESREIPIAGKTPLQIQLRISVSTLDETVIKGYYNTTKRLNTGSVSRIPGPEISDQIVNNPLLGMQGKAAGVFIASTGGLPGSNITVRIRGQNSIAAGNDPLYIVDGVPFSSTPLNRFDNLNAGNGKISPFSSINPSDIESVEILKDADATALYGSRGANGVVLITTKKGKAGKTSADASVYTGISRLSHSLTYLNTGQYLDLRKEAFRNDNAATTVSNAPDLFLWKPQDYTNWQKFLTGGTAHTTEAQLTLSGGSQHTRFSLGANYHRETSVYPENAGYQRAGAHFNLQHSSLDNRLNIETSFQYSNDHNDLFVTNGSSQNSLPPNFPLYKADGSLNWTGGINPLAVFRQTSKSLGNNLIGNAVARLQLWSHLQVKAIAGYTNSLLDQLLTYPLASQNPSSNPFNYTMFGHNQVNSFIVEPQLLYDHSIVHGSLKMIAGFTWQETERSGSAIQAINYSNELLMESLSSAGGIGTKSAYSSNYKYASLYALLNYNYKDKYLLNGSFRRDGSSRFGPGQKFGNFGAAGAGWMFYKESFLSFLSSLLSYGKLRGSYGITGNDQITDYQYLATYTAQGNYQNTTTLRPSRIANPLYSWETNRKTEIALELGFFKDRLLLTTNWYRNSSSNQLVNFPLATQTGFSSYQANLPAIVINKGWEIELQSDNFNMANFKWTTTFNISFQKNTLSSYPGLASSSYANTLVIGKDLSVVKGYQFTMVDPQTGIAQYADLNKDGVISNPADYAILGKTSPDFFGGLNNTLRYKRISLDVFLRFVKQKGNNYPIYGGGLFNMVSDILERWQKPGDLTNVPRLSATPGSKAYTANLNLLQSDAVFKDASFIRLQSVQVSWQFPETLLKKMKMANAHVFLKGQNLWMLTKYKGLDPETQNSGFPFLSSYAAGVNLSF
jgi:TonB-linked SusC/RagA family outer membrane protein